MRKSKLTKPGPILLGFDYQDVIALQLILVWLSHPDRFQWVEVEASEGSLNDVRAMRADGTVVAQQIKYSTDAASPDDPWTWRDLLRKDSAGSRSLLQKWAESVDGLRKNAAPFQAEVLSNRRASDELRVSCDGRVCFDDLASVHRSEIAAHLRGEAVARATLDDLRFRLDHPALEAIEDAVRSLQDQLGFTDLERESLRRALQRWSRYKNEPRPGGRIRLDDIKLAVGCLPNHDSDLAADIRGMRRVFVEPAEWTQALDLLRTRNMVILTGPPHIGKSATARMLVDAIWREKDLQGLRQFSENSDLAEMKKLSGSAIVLDDPFGATHLARLGSADSFDDIVALTKRCNYTVITTRDGILNEAKSTTRLGEFPLLEDLEIRLSPEHSYDEHKREEILRRHVEAASEVIAGSAALSREQAELLMEHQQLIAFRLHFPHNIEHLVWQEARKIRSEEDLGPALDRSKRIEVALGVWFENLVPEERTIAALVALFPGRTRRQFREIQDRGCKAMGQHPGDVELFVSRWSGYIPRANALEFGHPSYRQAIVEKLRGRFYETAGRLIQAQLHVAARSSLRELSELRELAGSIFRHHRGWEQTWTTLDGEPSLERYLQRFLSAYETIISRDFNAIRNAFDPGQHEGLSIHIAVGGDGQPARWALAPSETVGVGIRKIPIASLPLSSHWVYPPDSSSSVPEFHACEHVLRQLRDMLDENSRALWQRLRGSWHFTYDRVFTAVSKFGVLSEDGESRPYQIDPEQPLTTQSLLNQLGPVVLPLRDAGGERQRLYRSFMDTVDDLKWLEQQGHVVNGPLLLGPDIPLNRLAPRPGGFFTWDMYSDGRLRDAAIRAILYHFDAYRSLVDFNFPAFRAEMHTYAYLPVRVLAVVDLRSAMGTPVAGNPAVHIMAMRGGPSCDQAVEQIDVCVFSERTGAREVAAAQANIDRIRNPDRREALWTGGMDISDFIDDEWWRSHVLRRLKGDLVRVVGRF